MFTWSQDKNDLLKRHRGVAFEDVAIRVLQGDIVNIEQDHKNRTTSLNVTQGSI